MECKNLIVVRKTTKTYEIRIKKNGISEDITDWTIYFTVKAEYADSDDDAIIKKDITTHEDATNGKTLITLSSTDTDKTAGNYHYDIKYKDDEDNIGILSYGKFKIAEAVTQRQ